MPFNLMDLACADLVCTDGISVVMKGGRIIILVSLFWRSAWRSEDNCDCHDDLSLR